MKTFNIDKETLTHDLIGFLGISSGFFQLFQVVVKDEKVNGYVLILCMSCFLVYFVITKRQKRTPLRKIDDYFLISHLMRRLGFYIATPDYMRKDKLNFFVVEFDILRKNLDNKTLVGTIKKIISKNV